MYSPDDFPAFADEKAKDFAHDEAKDYAHDIAHEAAEEAAKESANEASQVAYNERYAEVYDEKYRDVYEAKYAESYEAKRRQIMGAAPGVKTAEASTGVAQALAEYIRNQARWRDLKAEEYPEDARNGRCAEALRELADHVAELPDEDGRLLALVAAGAYEQAYSAVMLPEQAVQALSGYGFHSGAPEAESFLEWIVRLTQEAAGED